MAVASYTPGYHIIGQRQIGGICRELPGDLAVRLGKHGLSVAAGRVRMRVQTFAYMKRP
jgi:hypothetical protein